MMRTGTILSREYELAVVMPVYNEADCIAVVITSWREMLCALQVNFVMIVINDGSRDRTADILQEFAGDERIHVLHQANMGHGPAVVRGYAQAVQSAEWVFQCDSDNEISPGSFPDLWEMRHDADAVFGCRQRRRQSLQRKLVSVCSRMAVRLLFGPAVKDVNTPYRLMRSSILRAILAYVPPDTFAPNVIVSGLLAFMPARVRNVSVPCRRRQTGCVSIANRRLWKAALRSFRQTWLCSRRIRSSGLRCPKVAQTLGRT